MIFEDLKKALSETIMDLKPAPIPDNPIEYEYVTLDRDETDNSKWLDYITVALKDAKTFEIHCWNEETEWIELALQYGSLKDDDWRYGKIVAGDVTPEFVQMLLRQPIAIPQADAILGDRAPFLSVLEEKPDNELHIKINSAFVGEREPEMADGLDQSVASVVAKCRPLLPSSRVIDIRFESYIMYQVRNESFSSIERKARQGKYLGVYDESFLLKHLAEITDVQQGSDDSFYPAPWKHYSVFTQNQVIDIISHCEPVLIVGMEDPVLGFRERF